MSTGSKEVEGVFKEMFEFTVAGVGADNWAFFISWETFEVSTVPDVAA